MFIAASFTIAKIWKQSKCPSIDEEDVVYLYIHSGVLLSHKKKKNEVLPFVTTWMDLETITISKISQTKKDKYCMISLTLICGI